MNKFYLFIFIGIAAVVAIVVILINFNPKAETWTGLFIGAVAGLLTVKGPAIFAWLKKRNPQKNR